MANTYIFKTLSLNNAEQFKESFSEPQATVGYVFIGNHVPYVDENSPPAVEDSLYDEKSVWDNMFAAKKITGNDVELVIQRFNWTANTKYKQYDDLVDITDLLVPDGSSSEPMYVITSNRDVYKCLSNNKSALSTIEPSGDYTTANGTIVTTDGYTWKYMYNIKPSSKFLTEDWMPAPTSTSKLDYNVSDTNVVDGQVTTIVVTNGGSGYTEPTTEATAFGTGVSTIYIANTSNIVANMTVSGTGISTGTIVTSVNAIYRLVTVSPPTSSNGGGTANNLTFSTRVYINGDGQGMEASSNIVGGEISKVTVDVTGYDYTTANVSIFGSGIGATARSILLPKRGHGHNPAKELGATNVMVVSKIGSVDATEGGVISTDTSFRQFGFLRDPYKYGELTPVTNANSNTVISQTTDLTIIAGTDYNLNEFVYQGTSVNDAYFYGFVNAQSSNQVRLTRVKGQVSVGTALIGANSGVSRTVVGKADPEFEPYTGDILYVDNVIKVQRADSQAENIKFVIRF